MKAVLTVKIGASVIKLFNPLAKVRLQLGKYERTEAITRAILAFDMTA